MSKTIKPNQFSPSAEQVEAIKGNNLLSAPLERLCWKCGHKPCSSCGDWCDFMMSDITWSGNWSEFDEEFDEVDANGKIWPPIACCEMRCTYF